MGLGVSLVISEESSVVTFLNTFKDFVFLSRDFKRLV